MLVKKIMFILQNFSWIFLLYFFQLILPNNNVYVHTYVCMHVCIHAISNSQSNKIRSFKIRDNFVSCSNNRKEWYKYLKLFSY